MKLLLDTHTFLWWDSQPAKLSARALAACQDPNAELLFSAASALEIVIKTQIGKLKLPRPIEAVIADQRANAGLRLLPATVEHALAVQILPLHHRDPFDRLLIAQATVEGLSVVSADPAFSQYAITVIW